jgi:hypothetical protein
MQVSHDRSAVPVQGLPGLQTESWRLLWEELLGDAEALAECRTWEARRGRVRPQALELLGRFLDGAVDVEELRETFDHRTKTDWDAFGLKGSSGAMFLNALVKHAPDAGALAARLREALPAPSDADAAGERLREFVDFLHAIARDGSPAGRPAYVVQPARAAFFVGMWWHLQEPERWPGFHPSARRALQLEGDLYVPAGDPIEDYFAFREAFLALATALGVTVWALEYLCWWREHGGGEPASEADGDAPRRYRTRPSRRPLRGRPLERVVPLSAVREPAPSETAPGEPPLAPILRSRAKRAGLDHTHVQWLLARLGRKLGCRVWIAANDHRRPWQGEMLGALSISRLPPLGLDPDSQRVISLIDVVWLRGANQVVAAFEVEHTSSIYSGLLRMADLAALSPNLNFPLYIVAPAKRLAKVRRELARPTFQALELHRRCAFFSGEALLDAADSIMRWASGPAAIEKLALRADEAVGAERSESRSADRAR